MVAAYVHVYTSLINMVIGDANMNLRHCLLATPHFVCKGFL